MQSAYHIISFLCFTLISISGISQNVFQPKQLNTNSKGIIYSSERAYDFRILTNGFSIGMSSGQILTYYRTTYYHFEFGYLKDSRERRQNKNINFASEGTSSSFAYGKRNSLFFFKAGYGEKRYLTEKARRKGLALGVHYEGGITLAILKPYYLQLIYTDEENFESEIREENYSEENRVKFLDYDDIFGGSGFFKGLTKTSFNVGLHAKLGAMFAFGAYDRLVKNIETGIAFDFYPTKIPMLVERDEIKNRRLFLNLYIAFQFGKRQQ